MRIIEDELSVGRDGSLHLSAEYLKEMGLSVGDKIRVAFAVDNSDQNVYREFLIGGLDSKDDGQASIQIPTELLQKAGLSLDEDLDIVCLDGGLLICRDTLLNEQELTAVMDAMDIAVDFLSHLPDDPVEAMQRIEDVAQV